MSATILPTRNEAWGFWGTMTTSARTTDTASAWQRAFLAITAATDAPPEGVRDFLDSRQGRHFADDVTNGLASGLPLDAAIDAAITRWMGWTIGRRESRETGIPAGMPTLTGYAHHFAILAEADA